MPNLVPPRPGQIWWNAKYSCYATIYKIGAEILVVKTPRVNAYKLGWPTHARWRGRVPEGWSFYKDAPR